MPIGHRVNNDDWRAAGAAIPGWGETYCAVLVAAADADGDVVATFGLDSMMTSVGDCAESGARTITVLGGGCGLAV
jgi:hypothetical protein